MSQDNNSESLDSIKDTGLKDISPCADAYKLAQQHRRKIQISHNLGSKKKVSECLVCGHSVCRCADRIRRQKLNQTGSL